MEENSRMRLVSALQVLLDLRRDQVVVTTMGAAREWMRLSDHRLDFHFVPSTMGGGLPLALGIALAVPSREVIVLSGDGSLLMSLGSLVTVAASEVPNLTAIIIDNGVYEITGGQKLVTSLRPIDSIGMARAAGFTTVAEFDELSNWKSDAAEALTQPGPRIISLKVAPVRSGYHLEIPGPMPQRIASFRAALQA